MAASRRMQKKAARRTPASALRAKKKSAKNARNPISGVNMVTGRVVGIDVHWCENGVVDIRPLDTSQVFGLIWFYEKGKMKPPEKSTKKDTPAHGKERPCGAQHIHGGSDSCCWWDGKEWHCPPAP